MNKTGKIGIGVDVGGSHISCAVIDLDSKEYLGQTFSESELDNHAPADEIMKIWGNTIERSMLAAGRENVAGVGFAMPGPFDYLHGISLFRGENDKYENTYGLDVPKELRKMLDLDEDFPVRFINDATAFAVGEDRFGEARYATRSLSITLGTGFGSAFIRDTLPVLEGNEVPEQGCLWHLPFEDGIADDYFSTRGLIKRFKNASGIEVTGVKQIADMAENDDTAREIFRDFGLKMGKFLEPWIRRSGTETLVIGGNISKAINLFRDSLEEGLGHASVGILASKMNQRSAIIGSAYLMNDDFYDELVPLLAKM